jgi:hypothetical protein
METIITDKEYTSSGGTCFQVLCSGESDVPRCYGIKATSTTDAEDFATAENLFFTQSEATEYCRWLAENDVYPISLCDVLANIYIL